MSFFNILSEKLESQRIYDGLKGKYETRFLVDGKEYTFLATTIAGECHDDYTSWMLEFENTLSHRIDVSDNNPKVAKAFGEVVGNWVKENNPHNFYTYGSHIDSLKSIIESIKKSVKGYNLIDDTSDKKNEDTGDVIEGNPIAKIVWTKMVEQEAIKSEDIANTKQDEFEKTYEEPKDLKTPKSFMTSKKDEKLDKNDDAYDLKTESVDVVDSYVKKFKDKMKSASQKTAIGWVDGIKGISKENKDKIKKKLKLPVKTDESWEDFKKGKI